MAKAWRATTTIKAGLAGTFAPGDIVTGLTKENMKQLWEAGALKEATVGDDEQAETQDPALAAATNGLDASGGSASDADGTKE